MRCENQPIAQTEYLSYLGGMTMGAHAVGLRILVDRAELVARIRAFACAADPRDGIGYDRALLGYQA